jgi:hypothetical protein
VFTDNPLLHTAEADHRDHAIIEQLNAELIDGPLAHLPSGVFTANAAWLTCAGIAHNLLRGAAALGLGLSRHGPLRDAAPARDRRPGRLAHRGRDQIVLHLPEHWPWYDAWDGLFEATHRTACHAPPAGAA